MWSWRARKFRLLLRNHTSWFEVFSSSMKFSIASFHNIGSFTLAADDGCWFPLFVEGVVDVNRVTRLEGLCVVVCVTIVVDGLLLLAFEVGLAMEVCLRVMRRQRKICRRH